MVLIQKPVWIERFIIYVIKGLMNEMFIFSRSVGKGLRAQVEDFIHLYCMYSLTTEVDVFGKKYTLDVIDTDNEINFFCLFCINFTAYEFITRLTCSWQKNDQKNMFFFILAFTSARFKFLI